MTRITFPLCAFFLFAGHLGVHAESARVEGRGECSTFLSHFGCAFTIWLSGEIDSSTVNKVKEHLDRRRAFLADKPERGPYEQDAVFIDSLGGNVAAAMAIGRMIRKERLALNISEGHECVSACVMVLAGAVNRGRYGKVGIHRPFFALPIGSQPLTSDNVRSNYQKMLQELRAYLREMNVSERLADDMLAIDPADVRYLSINQLDDYGLRWTDPIEQETVEVQEAQALGLDRREYMRRKRLTTLKCWGANLKTIEAMGACIEGVMKFGR